MSELHVVQMGMTRCELVILLTSSSQRALRQSEQANTVVKWAKQGQLFKGVSDLRASLIPASGTQRWFPQPVLIAVWRDSIA